MHVDAPGIEDTPQKQLFALEKVMLQPGASARVRINSSALAGYCAFCSVDMTGVPKVRPGSLHITVGTGGNDSGSVLLSHMVKVI